MISYSKCPLCNSEKIQLHLSCKDHFLSGEHFDLFKCSTCNFVFTQNHPDESLIGKYYESEDYISHSDTSEGIVNKLYKAGRNIMLKIKVNMIKRYTGLSHGDILDVGCGAGFFGGAMKSSGWNVTGIEINEKARKAASSRFGFNIISPENISSLPSGSFDCVTLWHVMEHFNEPESYLAEIKRLLKPGGLCLVALPNSSSFDADHYKEFWAAYDVPRHLWHFEPDTFKKFILKTGFNYFKLKSLPFDVFYISILSEKYRNAPFYFLKGLIKGKIFFIRSLFKPGKNSSLIYFLNKTSS